jgi:hypothetical protein
MTHMFRQIRRLSKGPKDKHQQPSKVKEKELVLLAILALERLDTVVRPLVNRQCTRYSEGLTAAR